MCSTSRPTGLSVLIFDMSLFSNFGFMGGCQCGLLTVWAFLSCICPLYLFLLLNIVVPLVPDNKGGIAPNQVIARSEFEVHLKFIRSECDEGRKEMFYLTTHSTHFIYGYMASVNVTKAVIGAYM